jgi:hypothetical protein
MPLESSGFTFNSDLGWRAVTAGASRLCPNLAAMSALGIFDDKVLALAMSCSGEGRMLSWRNILSSDGDPPFHFPTTGMSGESEGEQARAQEDETRRGYRQKSIRYEVMIAHGTPAKLNARPNLLKFETNSLAPYLIPSCLNYNISFNINE